MGASSFQVEMNTAPISYTFLYMNENILLIEDDDVLAKTIQSHLEVAGYSVHLESDGQKAIEAFKHRRWDVVLLDLSLPKIDGWDVCRYIRSSQYDVPILMITGYAAEAHCVLGLELGADGYLVKPFPMLELIARIRAAIRRNHYRFTLTPEPLKVAFGNFLLDPLRRELLNSGESMLITRREFDLLWFFASNPRRVFTRAHLLQQVWGSSFDGFEHAVNSQINRLRAKIEQDPDKPKHILTVWGVGYRFEPSV